MPSRRWRRGPQALLFLLPAGALLFLFVFLPTVRALVLGGHDASLLAPEEAEWVGLDNYSDLVGNPRFRHAFRNTALFALMVVPVQTVAALFLALWVNRPERYWRWMRVAFFLPVVISMPVLAVLWSMLYQPARGDEMGLINAMISTIGLPPQAWLQNPHLALPAIAGMSIWQGVGFQMMIFLAGLQHVSQEQIESSLIDGAGPAARLWFIILPAIRNSVIFAVIVTTILSFRLFVQPYLMTRGGPQDSTLSVIQWIYETTFLQRDLGIACAAALLFLIVVGALSLIQRRVARERAA